MTPSAAHHRILLERMMHRQSIAVPGESMASYALLKLIPVASAAPVLPPSLALALDISGSMCWDDGTGKSRLDRMRDAALVAVGKLCPTDKLAIVAFANGARVVLPATPVGEKEKIADVLKNIDRFDVDQAGTMMHEGIALAFSGKYVVAQVEVGYRSERGEFETIGPIALEMSYTEARNGYVNAEVARHIDEVQIFELNANLQQAISSDNPTEIERVAQQIAAKGDLLGPRASRKTRLARQVLEELTGGGKISKKTQLAVDDATRQADETPPI